MRTEGKMFTDWFVMWKGDETYFSTYEEADAYKTKLEEHIKR